MKHWFLTFVVLVVAAGLAYGEIPQVIGYQGRMTDNSGVPVTDGTYTMRFRIYTAQTGGTLLWDSNNQSVPLAGGIFNVMLGESPQPALGLDFDQDYWLLVTFAGQNQAPRKRLGSVGYAYMASGLVPGTDVSGSVTSGTFAALRAGNTATSGQNYGLYGQASSASGRAVYGWAQANTGTNYGVYGRTSSNSGYGVYGLSGGTAVYGDGGPYGVYGTGTTGVYGVGDSRGVYGTSSESIGTGVYGYASATSGNTFGVVGTTDSPTGRGVYGSAGASTGQGYGVYGEAHSSDGYGVCGRNSAQDGTAVYGEATSTSGTNYGGEFETASSGAAVKGVNTANIAGMAHGVYGETQSYGSFCAGVYGRASSSAGVADYGVLGESKCGIEGIGVYGKTLATNPSGTTYGVWGTSSAQSGTSYGVYGDAQSSDGYGVCGKNSAQDGTAVYGEATATSGTNYGGKFQTVSPYGAGVLGLAQTTTGMGCGGFFQTWSGDGQGVVGVAIATSGFAYGGLFNSYSTSGTAVQAYAVSTTGTTYGVYGADSSPSGYGVWYSGGFGGSGKMSSAVLTSRGPTSLGVHTTAGDWVEDFGEDRLDTGRCHVELDPLFLETVTVDAAHPMKVFVELGEDCNGVFVRRGATGFDVVELHGGSSSVPFCYRVVAKRKGFEERRLDYCEAAETDPYLYPDLREKLVRAFDQERALMEEEHARTEETRPRLEQDRFESEEKGAEPPRESPPPLVD